MIREHGPKVTIKKVSKAKEEAIQHLEFSTDPSIDAIGDQLSDTFGCGLLPTNSRGVPTFLVQETTPFTHEYRVAVVGTPPVAGAVCIERLCPP